MNWGNEMAVMRRLAQRDVQTTADAYAKSSKAATAFVCVSRSLAATTTVAAWWAAIGIGYVRG